MASNAKMLLQILFSLALSAAPMRATADADLNSAQRAYEASDYNKAIQILQDAAEKNPRDAEIHLWLAKSQFELRYYDAAASSVEKAIAIAPDNSIYHEWLGRSLGEKASHASWLSALALAKKAQQEFETSIKLDSHNFAAYQALIEYDCAAPGIAGGGEEKAQPKIAELAAMDAGEGHYAAGNCRRQKKDFAAADAEFDKALLTATSPNLIYDIGDYAAKRGHPDRLMAVADAGQKRAPRDVREKFYRAVALILKKENPEGADRLLREYLKTAPVRTSYPHPAAVHEWLGKLAESKNDRDAARREYETSLQLDPKNKPVQEALKRLGEKLKMHIRETVSVAIDALRSNKVRATLTSLGVIIGSASIVLVVTVALTSKKFVISQIEGVGSNLVWAEMVHASGKAQPLSYEITMGDLNAMQASPGVLAVAGTRELPMSVVVSGAERPVNLIGVTEGFQTIRRLVIYRGRYFDSEDMESRSKVCLITKELSERVFGLENPLSRTIRMGELTFTVIGVFRERVATFGLSEIQKESVIIPLTLMKYYTGDDVLRVLYAQAQNPEAVAGVEREMGRLLKSRHPLAAEYDVQTLVAILGAARTISLALTIVLLVIAAIALLISGIGIMNIMLVTVRERTREIGIRKAIGAAHKEILYQFLIEAFLISGGGAVLGILIGLAIPVSIQPLLPGNLRVPISGLSVIVAFVVSCSTGLFFGYLPANQAAKLQPIESLRYE